MTAPKVSRDTDVRLKSDSSRDEGGSNAELRPSRRSALLSAGICLLLAGLTTGCEKADTGNQVGVMEAALVPPPPVNQNIGIYDRTFTGFEATTCLGCHDPSTTDPTTVSDSIALRHHMMLDPSSPRYKPQYFCTDCHQPDGTGAMSVTLNCPTCHTSTPHHKSAPAQARHCAACHGSVINNFDDGHYIPTYKKSIVTPDPNCRVWEDAAHTTCAAGGCRTCHVASTSVTPNTWDNDQTHHGTGLGQGGAGSANPPEQCGWCHNIASVGGVPTPAIDIRTCETCHGPTSLHGIEFQYDTNKGNLGFGHIGADFDCWGCHGFFNRYALPPSFGPTIPTIDSIAPMVAKAGVTTQITLTGQSFTNTVVEQNTTYAPEVVLSVFDDARTEVASYVVNPDTFTQAEVKFTIPADVACGMWNVRVFKARGTALEVKSNDLPVAVPCPPVISSAVLNGSVLTVSGTGLGASSPPGRIFVLHNGPPKKIEACTVVSWTATTIVADCPNTVPGDVVYVFNGRQIGSGQVE
jgi:hypothetical protein